VHVASHRSYELDGVPSDAERLAQGFAKLHDRLTQRCARSGIGMLAPKQGGELLARMGSWLDRQVGQERQRLGAERRNRRRPADGESGGAQQRQADAGHGALRGGMAPNLRRIHALARLDSRWFHGPARHWSLSFDPIRSRSNQEQAMMKDSGKSRPTPAPDKKTEPRRADEAKELDVQELEERVAPMKF
jgi:hypothetical protein